MGFAEKLYEICREYPGNVLISPYSIHVALAMVKEGAVGRTNVEMNEVLGNLDPVIIDTETVKTANAVWLRCVVDSAWRVTVWRKYGGEARDIRDVSDPELQINQWVSEKTAGKITHIVDRLADADLLVITNAVHFKDDWDNQFEKERTKKEDFYVSETDTVKVDMMTQTRSVGYKETDSYQAIRLPYKDGKTRMTIILPKSRTGKISMGEVLNTRGRYTLGQREVEIYLPKFTMNCSYSLNEALISAGMPTAFGDEAEFPGISLYPLKIGEVRHKTFIEVDEEGTEAAAATGLTMRMVSMVAPPRPVVFRVDHPFTFYIEDDRTTTILFIGKVDNPRRG